MKYFEFTAYLEPCYAGFLKSYNLCNELRGFAPIPIRLIIEKL